MAGLINTAMGGTKKDEDGNFLATTTGYDASTRTVDQNKETVAGQLNSVLANDSPVLQRARAGATQTANARGLQNSSMAAQAGEAAVIDAATPIAAADASIYGTASRDNQAVTNQASQFNAGESNNTSRFNADAGNQVKRMQVGAGLETGLITSRAAAESGLSAQSAAQTQALAKLQEEIQKGLITSKEQADTRLQQLQGEIEKQLITARSQSDLAVQGLRGAQATALAQIEANYKQLIQANDSAGALFQTTASSIAALQADPNTSAEQKQAAVDKLSKMLEAGLTIIGSISDTDLAGLLDFSDVAGAPSSGTPPPAPPSNPYPPGIFPP